MPARNLSNEYPAAPAAGSVTERVLLGGAGKVTLVVFPKWARRAVVYFMKADDTTDDSGKYHHTGTQGADIDAKAYGVGAGIERPLTLSPVGGPAAERMLAFAGTTADGYLHVSLEKES